MPRGLIVMLAVGVLAVVGGCGKSDGNQFVGKWENRESRESVEITRNGDGFLIADTHVDFLLDEMRTDKIPATYENGVLQIVNEFRAANVGYDKANDTLLMPTMDGKTAALTRVE